MTYIVLKYNLDLVAFAVLLLAGFGLTARWVRRTTGGARFRRRSWALMAAVALAGVATALVAGDAEDGRLRQMISGLAPTYADEMARLGHAKMTADTPATDPAYLGMIDALLRWQRLNPFAADIYTFGRRADGQIVLLVDAETDYDHNGRYDGDREQRTPIGEPYAQDTPLLGRAFDGETVFTRSPTTDRWGTWVSTYTPIPSRDGSPVKAVLGIDYPAADWVGSILAHRAAMLGLAGTAGAVIAGVLAASTVARVEAEKRAEMHRRAATHDSLTGLPNRTLLHDRLSQAVRLGRRRPDVRSALLFIDCDGFKAVNDTHGHAVGDLLLKAIAGRVTAALRSTDTLSRPASEQQTSGDDEHVAARLGGDEFCVLLQGLAADDDAVAVTDRILGEIGRPFVLDGRTVNVSASIGVALGPGGYVMADEMVRDADAAMYRAKAGGKAQYVVHGRQTPRPATHG